MEKLIKIVNEQPCKKIVFTDFQGLSLNFYKNSEQRKPESFRETNDVILKVNDKIIGVIEEHDIEYMEEKIQKREKIVKEKYEGQSICEKDKERIECWNKITQEKYQSKKDKGLEYSMDLWVFIFQEDYKNKGFMTQAMRVYLRVLFEEFGGKIFIRNEIERENNASQALHKKLGFTGPIKVNESNCDDWELEKSAFEKADQGLKQLNIIKEYADPEDENNQISSTKPSDIKDEKEKIEPEIEKNQNEPESKKRLNVLKQQLSLLEKILVIFLSIITCSKYKSFVNKRANEIFERFNNVDLNKINTDAIQFTSSFDKDVFGDKHFFEVTKKLILNTVHESIFQAHKEQHHL